MVLNEDVFYWLLTTVYCLLLFGGSYDSLNTARRGQAARAVPRLQGGGARVREGVLPAESHAPDPRHGAREEAAVPHARPRGDGRVGGDGAPERARRRQRPRHRRAADRAQPPDGRVDPRRGPPALVHPRRAHPRPRRGAHTLRRAAVGGGRRHLPRRLPLRRENRLPRVLRRQPRLTATPLLDAVRRLRRGLRVRPSPLLLGARRVPLPRRQGLPARGGALHDPLPLGLRHPPRARLRTPHERARPRAVPLGARLQPPRPLLQGGRAPRRRSAETLLRRAGRRILPGQTSLVNRAS